MQETGLTRTICQRVCPCTRQGLFATLVSANCNHVTNKVVISEINIKLKFQKTHLLHCGKRYEAEELPIAVKKHIRFRRSITDCEEANMMQKSHRLPLGNKHDAEEPLMCVKK